MEEVDVAATSQVKKTWKGLKNYTSSQQKVDIDHAIFNNTPTQVELRLKMVVTDSETIAKGEVGSQFQSDQQYKSPAFPSVGRQSSIYSLTLDEFQHSVCEAGKNFGSMNMDEFINSIWTAEENQTQAQNPNPNPATTANSNKNLQFFTGEASSGEKTIIEHTGLTRQGSLTLPPPLCRKTVDEVWADIHKSRQGGGGGNDSNVQNSMPTQRQPTFGEMTLEDFLVKAGVVREQCKPTPLSKQQQFGVHQNNNHPGVGPGFASNPVMGGGGGGRVSGSNMPAAAYQTLSQGGGRVGVGESSEYAGNGKRSGGYQPPPPLAIHYGGRVANVIGGGGGGSGYGQVQGLGMGMGSPVSPVSSDAMCVNQVDDMNQYGMDMGVMRGGRKRIVDGPVEKVVERRQRRMIKNRESAARSRARKQAYTVELEAELNQLKEENAQLKQGLVELERKRKQQYFEEAKMKAPAKAERATVKLRVMRRSLSCPV